jgi:Cys2His2 zinc finger developmental/cell cycle regulator
MTEASHKLFLRWSNHTRNILDVFMEQLLSENLVDVTLTCEGEFIKAHKMVLSACSPYFQDLFKVHTVANPIIILNKARFQDMKNIIKFMYKGEVKVSLS